MGDLDERVVAGRVEWMADEDLTVLACDQACVGESGCDAAVQEPHGLDLAVAQIRKRGAQRVVVIGASAGGPRAIAVAADPPEGVVAVVALSPFRTSMTAVSCKLLMGYCSIRSEVR